MVAVAEEVLEETYCEDEAYNDDPKRCFYSLEALRFLRAGCLLCSCHNFFVLNFLVINELSYKKIILFVFFH